MVITCVYRAMEIGKKRIVCVSRVCIIVNCRIGQWKDSFVLLSGNNVSGLYRVSGLFLMSLLCPHYAAIIVTPYFISVL